MKSVQSEALVRQIFQLTHSLTHSISPSASVSLPANITKLLLPTISAQAGYSLPRRDIVCPGRGVLATAQGKALLTCMLTYMHVTVIK